MFGWKDALRWSVAAWLVQWGLIAFLAFHPAIAVCVLLLAAWPAIQLWNLGDRGRGTPSALDKRLGLIGWGAMTLSLVGIISNPLLLGAVFFPSVSLAALSGESGLFRLAAIIALGVLITRGPRILNGLNAHDAVILRRAYGTAALILLSQTIIIILSIAGTIPDLADEPNWQGAFLTPYWGFLQLGLHVFLAMQLLAATPNGTNLRYRIPFLVWTVLLLAGTLIDGRTVNEPNLATPLFAGALPATIIWAVWQLRTRVYWPALIPMSIIAIGTATVALDYVVRWWRPQGTAFDGGLTTALNLMGFLYPWFGWLAVRAILAEMAVERDMKQVEATAA